MVPPPSEARRRRDLSKSVHALRDVMHPPLPKLSHRASLSGLESRDELERLSREIRRFEISRQLSLLTIDGNLDLARELATHASCSSTPSQSPTSTPSPSPSGRRPYPSLASLHQHTPRALDFKTPRRPPIVEASPRKLSVTALTLLMLACGCCCQAPYDLMATNDRSCGDLISLAEILFGLGASAPWALRAEGGATLPLRFHFGLALSAVLSVIWMNRALASPIPAVVLGTLKNGNLVANAVVGALLLRKDYTLRQLGGVIVVTAGLVMTAVDGASHARPSTLGHSTAEPADDAATAIDLGADTKSKDALLGGDVSLGGDASLGEHWAIALGVIFICGSLLARALTGALQEAAFKRHRRASASEMLFFRNAIGLPVLLCRCYMSGSSGVLGTLRKWSTGEVGDLVYPRVWFLLATNLVFDYGCKLLMTRLVSQAGALYGSLVLTVQKFVAFALAVVWLEPALRSSLRLWAGAALVLLGTLAYATASTPIRPKAVKRSE